jgi:hypothetical protein
MSLSTIVRLACVLQLPQERAGLPKKGLPPSAGFFEGIFYESPSVPLVAAKSPATDSVPSVVLASAE